MVGWGIGKESWGIRYQKIYGDMLKEQVWQDLDNFLLGGFKKKDGTVLHIMSACIDTGGHHTDHGGTVGAKDMVDQRQGWRGCAVYPKPHH